MKICMVTHSLYESDHRVMRYAEALAARGDQVDVISLRKEGMPAEEIIFGVRVSRIHMRSFKEKKRLSFLGGVCALDRKSTRLNSSHVAISYAVFCLKKKKIGTKPVSLSYCYSV